jgi:hypothetical protein
VTRLLYVALVILVGAAVYTERAHGELGQRADAALTVATSSLASAPSRARCPGHRKGLVFYRDATWRHQAARGAVRARYAGAHTSPSCAYVAWAAGRWRERAAAERKRLEEWRRQQTVGEPWVSLAVCESGRRPPAWHINTGNGFYGGLQFTLSTWRAAGGTGYPHQHSPVEQVRRARILLAQPWGGFHHWPACSRLLGLR